MIKLADLVDGNGNSIKRKIRRDDNGLYILNRGRKGYLEKEIQRIGDHSIIVTRKVSHYVEK